jgi:hypothetical protein
LQQMQQILGKLLVSSTHFLHELKNGAQISSRRHLIVRFPQSLFLIIVLVFKKSRAWDESSHVPKLLLKLSIEMQMHSYSTLLRNISWPLKFLGARISLKKRHKHNCVYFYFRTAQHTRMRDGKLAETWSCRIFMTQKVKYQQISGSN